eukprot:2519301-Alexandrium_andersonii.AAC.1
MSRRSCVSPSPRRVPARHVRQASAQSLRHARRAGALGGAGTSTLESCGLARGKESACCFYNAAIDARRVVR